ncbi:MULTISPECIES: ATP-binding protein [unclassified Luteococcus]|uniref:ATP-binding protein n=1 Tax=unclassified Luteococcus TaxID=2639923 RepID=UPI00313CA024
MGYRRRTVDDELDDLLAMAPALALDGPKGVGKTATAERRCTTAYFLDQDSHRQRLAGDPTFQATPPGTILLDEWQRAPEVWDRIRRAVDHGAPPGRFLLTGSATPRDAAGTHSGAGRILSLRMRPMAFHERANTTPSISFDDLLAGKAEDILGTTSVNLTDYAHAITDSGFPGIMNQPPRLRPAHLDAYLLRVIDRDLPDLGLTVRRPETLRRWLNAYAAATATTTAYSKMLDLTTAGDGSQPAKSTTIAYRDHLTQLWLLDPLPGWSHSRSPMARLQQAPKHHLADPALAARLLNVPARTLLSPKGAHLFGPLFEALVTLSIRVMAQRSQARVGHLRTRNGDHEVDLVVEGDEGQVLGIEVKLSADATDSDVRHLHWLRDQLPGDVVDLVVVTTGTHSYRRADGVAVVPLALLGP